MKSPERAQIASEITKMLEVSQAIMRGHFILASGKHADTYVNKNLITLDPEAVSRIGELIALLYADKGIEAVAGPATAAISLGQMTAFHLQRITGKKVLSVYSEKEGETQVFKRGYDKKIAGLKVLAVEDILTTGGSLKQVVDLISKAGGVPVGAAAIINRDPTKANSAFIGAPTVSLLELVLPAYDEGKVPQKLMDIPINIDVGHGLKYLASKKS